MAPAKPTKAPKKARRANSKSLKPASQIFHVEDTENDATGTGAISDVPRKRRTRARALSPIPSAHVSKKQHQGDDTMTLAPASAQPLHKNLDERPQSQAAGCQASDSFDYAQLEATAEGLLFMKQRMERQPPFAKGSLPKEPHGTRKPPDSDHAQATAAYLELLEGRMDKRNGGSSIQTQPHGTHKSGEFDNAQPRSATLELIEGQINARFAGANGSVQSQPPDVALEMPFTFPGNVPRTAVHKQTSAVEATATSPARQKSLAAESDGAAGQEEPEHEQRTAPGRRRRWVLQEASEDEQDDDQEDDEEQEEDEGAEAEAEEQDEEEEDAEDQDDMSEDDEEPTKKKRAGVSTLARATLMAEEQELDTLSEHELQLFLAKKNLAHMVETTELLSSMNRGMCRLLKAVKAGTAAAAKAGKAPKAPKRLTNLVQQFMAQVHMWPTAEHFEVLAARACGSKDDVLDTAYQSWPEKMESYSTAANKYANKSVRGPAVKACQEAINEKYKNTMVDANGNLKAGAKNKFAGVSYRSKGKDEYELPEFRGALLLAFPGGDSTLDKIKHIHAPQIALFEFLLKRRLQGLRALPTQSGPLKALRASYETLLWDVQSRKSKYVKLPKRTLRPIKSSAAGQPANEDEE